MAKVVDRTAAGGAAQPFGPPEGPPAPPGRKPLPLALVFALVGVVGRVLWVLARPFVAVAKILWWPFSVLLRPFRRPARAVGRAFRPVFRSPAGAAALGRPAGARAARGR